MSLLVASPNPSRGARRPDLSRSSFRPGALPEPALLGKGSRRHHPRPRPPGAGRSPAVCPYGDRGPCRGGPAPVFSVLSCTDLPMKPWAKATSGCPAAIRRTLVFLFPPPGFEKTKEQVRGGAERGKATITPKISTGNNIGYTLKTGQIHTLGTAAI